MRFYIETFGCTSNFGNSQDLAEALREMGHIPSGLKEADMVIVNTCAVTERTERKILRRLRQLEGERLVVAGCLAAAIPQSIQSLRCRGRLGPLRQGDAARIAALFDGWAVPSEHRHIDAPLRESSPRGESCGIVNVADGCNGSCSYCIVSKARGRLKSRPVEDVVFAVKRLAQLGTAEIQISAQDTAAFGSDLGSDLAGLLETLTEIPGDFMLRVGMMNPDSAQLIQDRLIEAFQSPKIYRFLHIPVQSGSNEVLKSMGRHYSVQDFIDIVKAFRSSIPDISINTDVIVGFPGETDEDFEESMSLIKRLQPDKVNITRFSPRPGTSAARLYDMPDRIKKDRSREMTRIWLEIAERRNSRYLGKVLHALVTECGRGKTMKARSANYAGIVIPGALDLGRWCQIKIMEATPYYLSGILQL
jgi:MiaB-like tRNA modifying enzyme